MGTRRHLGERHSGCRFSTSQQTQPPVEKRVGKMKAGIKMASKARTKSRCAARLLLHLLVTWQRTALPIPGHLVQRGRHQLGFHNEMGFFLFLFLFLILSFSSFPHPCFSTEPLANFFPHPSLSFHRCSGARCRLLPTSGLGDHPWKWRS